MKNIIYYTLFLLCATSATSMAQQKWALLQDLNKNWLYYDEEWLPVTDRFDTYSAIFLEVPNIQQGQHLLIKYPEEFSVFLNEKIYYTTSDSLLIDVDSLFRSSNINDPLLAIYAGKLEPSRLRTQLLYQYNPAQEPQVNNLVNIKRKKTAEFKDFSIIALLVLLFFLVLLKTIYPRNLNDFYNLKKTISARDVDEDLLRGRLFSKINILIMLFQCLVIGLFITLMSVYLNMDVRDGTESFYEHTVQWIKYSVYVMGFVFLKFILIRNFTSLYNLYNFSTPHFMSYMRMMTISFALALVILYSGIYIFEWHNPESFFFGLNLALLLLGLGIFFIFLKLLNSVSFKKLHLFSYLCATEILPYVVILKVAINQSI